MISGPDNLPKMGITKLAKSLGGSASDRSLCFGNPPVSRSANKRRQARVKFSRGVPINILAIDGTWRRPGLMMDVADDGAMIVLQQNVAGLNLKEVFFTPVNDGLVLSSL